MDTFFLFLVVAGIAALLWKSFFPGYLNQKGKNLADKEDIEHLTEAVESVKASYTMLAEQYKATHSLRMAAIDKRLEAHQQAFVLWRKLLAHAYEDDIGQVVMECQTWWENNCLYLEPAVRDAFSLAYSSAHGHRQMVETTSIRDPRDTAPIMANWKRVTDCGTILLAAVQLPALSSEEVRRIAEVLPPHDTKPT